MVEVRWNGRMQFEAVGESGQGMLMDAYADSGGDGSGPTPMEALLAAIGGCAAMDVISILEKKRQTVTGYRIELNGERVPLGTWPRPFTTIRITHVLTGEGLDPVAVARAIELSEEKYCSVMATLREGPDVICDWRVEESTEGR
jgi:putative redox protein